MSRPKLDAPSYRYHISGQARVTLDGKEFFLGEFNSPESKAKYYALLAEYNANGQSMPDAATVHLIDTPITVRCVTSEFREHAKVKYANNESHRRNYLGLCNLLDTEYGNLPANEFGPRRLVDIRELFIASGNNRTFVNSQVRSICRIFKYAISRELIDVNVLIRLQTIEPLRQGQTKAPEPVRRQPIDLNIVKATAKELSPIVKSMVRIQAATGMRPSEVCNMRPCDIDMSCEDAWIYRPPHHKTACQGIQKAVPIVGDARLALEPFLARDGNSYCFSPREAAQWRLQQRAESRVTPTKYGNSPGTNKKFNPKRQPGNRDTKDSYRHAIQRAAKQAGVPSWTPYQLRYLAATEVRNALGVESAQALLGHTHVSMTEHYAKQTEAKVIQAARSLSGIGDA